MAQGDGECAGLRGIHSAVFNLATDMSWSGYSSYVFHGGEIYLFAARPRQSESAGLDRGCE